MQSESKNNLSVTPARKNSDPDKLEREYQKWMNQQLEDMVKKSPPPYVLK